MVVQRVISADSHFVEPPNPYQAADVKRTGGCIARRLGGRPRNKR
jgi:hypothetical protein